MLSEESFDKHVTTSDSCILDINESFVRSDIAEIISKMYTPKTQCGGKPAGDAGCPVLEAGRDRETVWQLDEAPKKRFGFYFESVATRNNIETSRDTTTSDVVSLPSVRSRQKRRHGFVCKCCKRQILHRISEKRMKSACSNCQRKYETKHKMYDVEKYGNQVYSKERRHGLCQIESLESKHKRQHGQQLLRDYKTLVEANHHTDANKYKSQKMYTKRSPVPLCDYNRRHFTEKYPTVDENVGYSSDQIHMNKIKNFQDFPELFECDNPNLATQERSNRVSGSKKLNKRVFRRFFGGVSAWSGIFNKKTKHSTRINEIYLPLQKNLTGPQLSRVQRKSTRVTEIEEKSSSEINQKLVSENQLETIFQGNLIDNSQTECCISCKRPILTNVEQKQELQSESRVTVDTNREEHAHVVDKEVQCEYQHHKINEEWAMQFWGKVFSFCHVAPSFLTAFVLQLLKFLLQSVTQPLIWGSLQIGSEYLFQPCLETLFSSVLKPIFILIQNIAASFRDIFQPIAQCSGYFLQEFAQVIRACRLFEIHHIHKEVDGSKIRNV